MLFLFSLTSLDFYYAGFWARILQTYCKIVMRRLLGGLCPDLHPNDTESVLPSHGNYYMQSVKEGKRKGFQDNIVIKLL